MAGGSGGALVVGGAAVVGAALVGGAVLTPAVGVGELAVWLGCGLGVAETDADGELPGPCGRSDRPGPTLVICSFAAGRSTGPLGATVGEVAGRLTAGSSPTLRVAA
ncbi:hypothetical protein JNW90_21390, partial [Micromonospora sp. STR1s_5]|nr:hypothetical protein [Micromonospora sp. STR1s_5]MBM0205308.1 hypothetical protein [Micromonospora sp. STR1s_5]